MFKPEPIEKEINNKIKELTIEKIKQALIEAQKKFVKSRHTDLLVSVPYFLLELIVGDHPSDSDDEDDSLNLLSSRRQAKVKHRYRVTENLSTSTLESSLNVLLTILRGEGEKNKSSLKYAICFYLTDIEAKTNKQAENLVNLVVECLQDKSLLVCDQSDRQQLNC